MIEQYESGSYPLLNSPRPYALMGTHKHIPEMQTHVGLKRPPLFLPVVSNFYRGLAVSVPLHMSMLQEGITGQAVHEALSARYAGEAFVRVMPLSDPATLESGYFDVQGSNDTNRCDLFVFASDKQIVLIGRIDNLGKGASGAAVQSMNLHLGLGEGAGL